MIRKRSSIFGEKETPYPHILNSRISRSLEKHLNLQSYDGIRDPDIHIEHVDDFLDYFHVHGVIK